LFARRRDLFTGLSLAFFDTTSLYFEGEGGESMGQRGWNKDHRPDLKQMVVGMVLSGEGRPICCEMWPGNTTDVKTLLPVVKRLRKRFGIQQVCIVADRGMISDQTIATMEDELPGLKYILGARRGPLRRQVGAAEQLGPGQRRGAGVALQGPLARRGDLPRGQDDSADAADLPQER
jgi:transposase